MSKLVRPVALPVVLALLAGCARNPEPVVRQRAQDYTQLLLDDNFAEAVNYYDPDIVAREGRTAVTDKIKAVVGFIKGLIALGGRKPAGFEVRKVDLDSTCKQATVQVVFYTTDAQGGDRREHPTDYKWVFKKNAWYTSP